MLLTIRQAAHKLGISEEVVRRLTDTDAIEIPPPPHPADTETRLAEIEAALLVLQRDMARLLAAWEIK